MHSEEEDFLVQEWKFFEDRTIDKSGGEAVLEIHVYHDMSGKFQYFSINQDTDRENPRALISLRNFLNSLNLGD